MFYPAEIRAIICQNEAEDGRFFFFYSGDTAILSFAVHEIALREKKRDRILMRPAGTRPSSVFVLFFVFSSFLTHFVSLIVFLDFLPDCVCTLCRYKYNTHS